MATPSTHTPLTLDSRGVALRKTWPMMLSFRAHTAKASQELGTRVSPWTIKSYSSPAGISKFTRLKKLRNHSANHHCFPHIPLGVPCVNSRNRMCENTAEQMCARGCKHTLEADWALADIQDPALLVGHSLNMLSSQDTESLEHPDQSCYLGSFCWGSPPPVFPSAMKPFHAWAAPFLLLALPSLSQHSWLRCTLYS